MGNGLRRQVQPNAARARDYSLPDRKLALWCFCAQLWAAQQRRLDRGSQVATWRRKIRGRCKNTHL